MKSLFNVGIFVAASLLSAFANSVLAQAVAPEGANRIKVEAILKVGIEDDSILPNLRNPFATQHLQAFINNQVALIKSQFVIKAALAPRDIAGLDLVQSQRNKHAWLSKSLEVQSPSGTSLIVLTLHSTGGEDALKAVLDSVVTAYQTEVVATDMLSTTERYRSVVEHIKELKDDFGQLFERHRALADEMKGQGDSTELRLLKIEMEALEDMLKAAEKAVRYEKLCAAVDPSPVSIVQQAMVVPAP